jgi:hypothetical protein
MSAPSISSITNTARNIPTLKIYEDFDKIIAKEVFFTETGEQSLEVEYMFPPKKKATRWCASQRILNLLIILRLCELSEKTVIRAASSS